MRSAFNGQHSFAMIPSADIQRSVFDRSHGHKTTFNAGYLIPIFVDDVLPGDTLEMRFSMFGRLPTLIRPIMDNVYVDIFFFYVPNRLVWSNWKKFMGEQNSPGDSTSYTIPQVTPTGGWDELSIYDYMGLPTKIASSPTVSALPFRAYSLIYHEWFRDENLINTALPATGDGPDAESAYFLRRRGKRHDYFTSALPWPQKGTAVSLPLGTTANVLPGATEHTTGIYTQPLKARLTATGGQGTNLAFWVNSPAGSAGLASSAAGGTAGTIYPTNLVADLTNATAATINDLRQAFQVQRLLERDARGGTRYTEIIRSHFGVVSPDARLQRPEYLGGGRIKVNVSAVPATNEATGVAIGDLGAFGTFGSNEVSWRQSFTEHGYVLGLACMVADLNYQQGVERHWSRSTRFDVYWPALANLGEQAILNKEIYLSNNLAIDAQTFGYQERYAEYRYKPSIVSGRLRSNAATPLDSWHLAQNFTSLPGLNQTFIEENPPIDRVVAIAGGTEPHAVADMHFSYKCARPMPVYSVPGLIDHF